ncbi:TolC family outer membrane protein [Aestuariirhabdus sp. Z084]|uniref:TolC family outer membrane protein n=1 Tax=Aestuariirhabdus haliotis TaxID=2918751 RepID=UPI00201B3731|nr:TolC family outer membrane protein [Aestuariirhabdus haliotis]MCL6415610.1 TolC family outer membrane protein [Aestuariirhabdus haliotis]MCL6419605.1 TolC family outer membrane protein [Aestuariirhabdus haliotis]
MAYKHLPSFLLAGLAALSTSVYAQGEPADLLEIYNQSLANDAELAAAGASLKANEELPAQGIAGLLPNISMSASTSTNTERNLDSTSNPPFNRTNSYNEHGWAAQLVQPVFRLERWFTYTRAKALSDQAKADYSVAQQDLILRVADAYFAVLRAEDTLTTTISEEKAFKRQLEQAEQRFEVGLIAQTDVHEARAVYDNARVNRIVAENDVEVSLERLRTLTAREHREIGSLDKEMPVVDPAPKVKEEWVNSSLVQNLNILAAREAVRATEETLKLQKAGHAPTVDAVARYNHSVTGNPSLTTTGFDGKQNSSYAGLELSLPIFSGGGTSSRVREATYRLQEAQDKLDSLNRQTSQRARNLFSTVVADVQRISARAQGIISTQSALEATESGYEVGSRNIVDVLNAQRNLYASQRDYLNARYDYILNTLRLKQEAGTLSPQDLSDLNQWISKTDTELLPEL